MKSERIWLALAGVAVIGGVVLMISSCDESRPQPMAYVQPATQPPVMVAQQQPSDHFWENVMLYHMLFGGNQTTVVHQYSRPAYVAPQRSTTVIHNTTIINRSVPSQAAPAPAVTRPAPTYTPPRATSYSGSYSPRSSYSSYSYSSRSSVSSFSGRR